MTLTNRILISLGIAALITLYAVSTFSPSAQASAPSGLPATVSTSSSAVIGAGASTLLAATSSNCSARIVSTGVSAVQMTFSDNQGLQPTGVYGVFQPASTTVAYDSGLYGCNAIRIFSFAAQPVSITETR